MIATVPNGDMLPSRYLLFTQWYKMLAAQENNLVLCHTDTNNKDQLEGIAAFPRTYETYIQWYNVIWYSKGKLAVTAQRFYSRDYFEGNVNDYMLRHVD